ncbi:MAG TPA: hypothetical protein VEY07_07775 [Thermoplasmata archaeon]|nr:hypothetical protein [Thermoplasmata archaeon]
MASVVIVGGTEETRLLLRGLLRLYRHRVVGEGPTFRSLGTVSPPDPHPTVAVIDLDLEDPEAVQSIQRAKSESPGLRILLLSANRTAAIETRAREVGVDALIRRPFAVHELMESIEPPEPTRQP